MSLDFCTGIIRDFCTNGYQALNIQIHPDRQKRIGVAIRSPICSLRELVAISPAVSLGQTPDWK